MTCACAQPTTERSSIFIASSTPCSKSRTCTTRWTRWNGRCACAFRRSSARSVMPSRHRRRTSSDGGCRDSGYKHGCALQATGAQIGKRIVGGCEGIAGHFTLHAGLRHQRQKFARIHPCEVGDRDDVPLLPEQPIGKTWNVRHVDAPTDHAPTFLYGLQRQGDERAYGREDNRGIERLGRHLVRAAGPNRAKRFRKYLRRLIANPGERVDAAALPGSDLDQNVRGGAKPVKAERL